MTIASGTRTADMSPAPGTKLLSTEEIGARIRAALAGCVPDPRIALHLGRGPTSRGARSRSWP